MLARRAERGWKFAVSADMSPQSRREIERLTPEDWHSWQRETGGFVREWAEVAYIPRRQAEKRGLEPNRFLAIRIPSPQGCCSQTGQE